MEFDSWLLFSSIALMATLTPGPAILLVSSHSVSFGIRPSVATMFGNISGLFVMALLSVMGLSAIILHSAPIFTTVKLIGAAYLIYLGIKLWRNGMLAEPIPAAVEQRAQQAPKTLKLYTQGLLVALSNPKAIAFCTALFPQFIQQNEPMLQQFSILIVTFMFLSFSCLFGYAMVADGGKKYSARVGFPKVFGKIFGAAFIGSGILLATASRK